MTDQQINDAIVSFVFDFVPTDSNVPNYCNDLNAMHEAEKTLMHNANLMNKYQNYELSKFVNKHTSTWLCRATARQRAEAFLRTVGKWKEVE